MAVRWYSRYALSPARDEAIRDLHGADVVIVIDKVPFRDSEDFLRRMQEAKDAGEFPYVVAAPHSVIEAALAGLPFGFFDTHASKRADGSFGLRAVYHVGTQPNVSGGSATSFLRKVWENPDPMGDGGEVLIPISQLMPSGADQA